MPQKSPWGQSHCPADGKGTEQEPRPTRGHVRNAFWNVKDGKREQKQSLLRVSVTPAFYQPKWMAEAKKLSLTSAEAPGCAAKPCTGEGAVSEGKTRML